MTVVFSVQFFGIITKVYFNISDFSKTFVADKIWKTSEKKIIQLTFIILCNADPSPTDIFQMGILITKNIVVKFYIISQYIYVHIIGDICKKKTKKH